LSFMGQEPFATVMCGADKCHVACLKSQEGWPGGRARSGLEPAGGARLLA
jgi:hypothetical protein